MDHEAVTGCLPASDLPQRGQAQAACVHVKSPSFHKSDYLLFAQAGGLDSLSLLTALLFLMEGMDTHFINKSRKIRGNVFSASELESIRKKALWSLLLKSSLHS